MLTDEQIKQAWDASYAAVPRYYSFARAIEAAASAETEALRKDAERYRWLRNSDHWPAVFDSHYAPEPLRGAGLDLTIDAEKGGA